MITDIRTESPFWLMKNGFLKPYPALSSDIKTDFAIIGGGISGALLAWNLAQKGASVAVIDRRHIGMGSTAASTALLQYDIDRALYELIALIGEKKAVRAYELSLKALADLEKIAKKLKLSGSFEKRSSIRFAKYKKDISYLEKESAARKKYGFETELWDAKKVADNFLFAAPAALYTTPSAIADPYLLTHGLLQNAIKLGARVFDKTGVTRIERNKRSVSLHTAQGHKISARRIVVACGYESVNYVPFKIGKLNSTFAVISEPLPDKNIWFENCSFWDTGDPYHYARTTNDNRIIFGGEDEPFYDPKRRDNLLPEKSKKLVADFKKLFPGIPFRADYSWAGTFLDTDDGLPFIGSIKQLPHTFFSLGYGGNGITFSQMAAELLTGVLLGRKNPDIDIFSFDRKTD
jgi:glycine/D-amino acid oxidase-like deaminating enzyme